MTTAATSTTLDVRPDLAAGREPFSRIMEAAHAIPPGGILVLLAPFEPEPLYSVLGRQGFSHQTDDLADEGFRITFHRTGP